MSCGLVLLIDDDCNDAELVRFGLRRVCRDLRLEVFRHGGDAVKYLRGEGHFADRRKHPLPGLILLDLSTPWFSGFEFLRWLRSQLALAGVPVVVLSGSVSDEDRRRVLDHGARMCLEKTADLGLLIENLREVLTVFAGLGHFTQEIPVEMGA